MVGWNERVEGNDDVIHELKADVSMKVASIYFHAISLVCTNIDECRSHPVCCGDDEIGGDSADGGSVGWKVDNPRDNVDSKRIVSMSEMFCYSY